jgi:hypothetical protein
LHTLSVEDGEDDEDTFTFVVDPQADVTSTPMLSDATIASPTAPTADPFTPTPAPAQTPAPGGGCGQGLLPIAGLVLVGLTLPRRRRP